MEDTSLSDFLKRISVRYSGDTFSFQCGIECEGCGVRDGHIVGGFGSEF